MLYYTFATLFAQLAITLRLVTISNYLTLTTHHTPRVYAVTGRNRWIASCLSFTTFVQVGFGMGGAIHYAFQPSMVPFCALRNELLTQSQFLTAVEFPDLPLDGYQTCSFQPWKTGEVIYFVLSLVYGTFSPSSATNTQHLIPSPPKTPWPCLSSCIPQNVAMEVSPVLVVHQTFSARSSKTLPCIPWFFLLATFFSFSSKFSYL